MSPSTDAVVQVPSVQCAEGELPRFRVPVPADDPHLQAVQEAEREGAIDPEVRTFLEAQLQNGDVYLDCDPGYGFAAMTAATAPEAVLAVLVGGLSPDRLQALQDAAMDVGGWLDGVSLDDPDQLRAVVDARLESEGRVVVRTDAHRLPGLHPLLAYFTDQGRLLAVAIGDAGMDPQWPATRDRLEALQLTPCILCEQHGDAILTPLQGAPEGPVLALPTALLGGAAAGDPEGRAARAAPAAVPAAVPAVAPEVGTRRAGWRATHDGFLLQTSHSRTGYGVAGGHLLRALQERGVPVALFPLGPVDPTIAPNPALQAALDRQECFRGDLPSVRIAQAFDLAQHIGRGPRVGFTIFELDTFTRRELHHLRQQDAIVVCSDWARQVCLQNGLTDRPIHVVPLGVDAGVFHPRVTPARRYPETVFLQVGKLEPRKGQRELLHAFEAAFTPKDPVRLVLACGNPFATREQMDAMLRPFRVSPMASRITLVTAELATHRDVAALMAGADCGVFPVRAEGWNLEALEMLAMGKTVIATHCTAHTEFLSPDNARLVEAPELEVAHAGTAVGRWAAWGPSQHEQLVAHLRAVHAARLGGTLAENAGGLATASRFSWAHAADRLVAALEAITGGLGRA